MRVPVYIDSPELMSPSNYVVKVTLLKSNINDCRGETRCNPESTGIE
jgi:hypothetical protein